MMRFYGLGAFLFALCVSGAVHADELICDNTGALPCGFELRDLRMQRVPSLFRFQTRISQQKLPSGKGTFSKVVVKLLRDNTEVCLEEIGNVKVRAGVLNLEVGRDISCELDEVLAESGPMQIQLCLGGVESCLSPIDLATVPLALKANYASYASQADMATVAGQANYAHRATADGDLFIRDQLGAGYFDFSPTRPLRADRFTPSRNIRTSWEAVRRFYSGYFG